MDVRIGSAAATATTVVLLRILIENTAVLLKHNCVRNYSVSFQFDETMFGIDIREQREKSTVNEVLQEITKIRRQHGMEISNKLGTRERKRRDFEAYYGKRRRVRIGL